MSFQKAEELLELAVMASGRRVGITLDDVIERFEKSRRTAQRMMRSLELRFPDTEPYFDEEGRKRWRLPPAALRDLLTLEAEELASLDLAIETLRSLGEDVEARVLKRLQEKILALVPRSKVARLETDHEALLEAQGLAARPGPRPRVDPAVAAQVSEAIKACRFLEILYRSRRDSRHAWRRIAPHGVLLGLRRYVVAKAANDLTGPIRFYRAEDIKTARIAADGFARDPSFNIRAFANRAFGVFQNDEEFGEVVWRFSPAAAEHARGFEFHPEQVMEDQPDGSLVARFRAAGHLEMCWHLYAWGDKVEVIAPERLRRLVEGYRRSDFPALP